MWFNEQQICKQISYEYFIVYILDDIVSSYELLLELHYIYPHVITNINT